MSVERYDPYGAYMEQRKDGDYVLYDDFERVFSALHVAYKSCVVFAGNTTTDTSAASIRDYLKPIVDQYE